ncbi:hypothetical protein RND71_039754 [Anisodus tanguticus]|uniref:Longin domain-containing protein n=1 Tax=Anisodus tanguticus TaxID=243964 RepID=A0AAE1QXY8_9SOLA|nr:hypothetical protein RND71_039754 [Anisodus tanguticus]
MDQIQKAVYYCSVSKWSEILYSYNGGDDEIEDLDVLCLERTPPYHKNYFQTMAKKTFGFMMEEEGYVSFAIAHREGLGYAELLRFLEQLRDEFRKGSSRSISNLNSLCLHEQLVPVIRHLITSLEHVSGKWSADTPPQHALSPYNNVNGQIEGGRAHLLAKPTRVDKKKMKDHAIAMRASIELEEYCKSTERDSGDIDKNNQGTIVPPPKEFGLIRSRSGSKNFQRRWCRQVRIVLAIDAAVCLVLFAIWLFICQGTKCLR